jgi:hypothetical protein
MQLRRRRFLAVGFLAALAGCSGDAGSDDAPTGSGETGSPTGTTGTGDSTGTTGTGDSTATVGLDLREANVTGVDIDSGDGRRFDVDVTLIHDDGGEDGYANWWQVETLEGERLGRRDLAHPHGTREFTRGAEIEIPADVSCVVVRGHDQTHAYGGRAMLVDVDAGATTARRQGSDPADFSSIDCP